MKFVCTDIEILSLSNIKPLNEIWNLRLRKNIHILKKGKCIAL